MNPYLSKTENGGNQLRSSGNLCLDLFAEVGSARTIAKKNPYILEDMFLNAYRQDPKTAALIMYWVRAVRDGAGERCVFHVLHNLMHGLSPKFVEDNLHLVGEFGYYKDYVQIYENIPSLANRIVDIFANGVKEGNYYACKWLPRGHKLYAEVKKKLGMSNGDFRRHVAKNSVTVEQKLCAKKISEIEYATVPSLAMNRYKKIFAKKDKERFLESMKRGEVKASVLFPHDILKMKNYTKEDALVADAQWNALPNFLGENSSGILTVLDTSNSMTWNGNPTPYEVAYPLSIYCSERVAGPFKDQIIMFSSKPSWIDLSGCKSATEKLVRLCQFGDCSDTNIAKTFKLILDRAISAKLPVEEMPKCVLILSDMQFNPHGFNAETTVMDKIRLEYKYAGYKMPAIIYWNLDATNTGIADNENCALVSGYSPRILKAVLSGGNMEDIKTTLDPMVVMEEALKPIAEKVNLESIVTLPKALTRREFNPSRGTSARNVPIATFADEEDDD